MKKARWRVESESGPHIKWEGDAVDAEEAAALAVKWWHDDDPDEVDDGHWQGVMVVRCLSEDWPPVRVLAGGEVMVRWYADLIGPCDG